MIEDDVQLWVEGPDTYHYRYDQRYRPGYVVYRARQQNSTAQWVDVHKVALFVTEQEAADYARYRNAAKRKYGTDAVEAIGQEHVK